jgi:hypothetical protein
MTWRAFFRPATLLFLALWLVLLAGGQSRFFRDPGTFWHTVVGDQILHSRGFFDTDDFTFTFRGKTWVPHQWLGECAMAALHAIDGFDSLLLATATLLAALFTWLGVRLMRCGLHPSIAAVMVALAVAASSGHFHVRPHLATIAGFAVTMAFLADFEAKRIGPGRLALLIPVYLVWSNMHGGVIGGLATFAFAAAGWTLLWRLGWESPIKSYQQAGIVVLILVGCAATAFINPYGTRLPESWLDIYRMKSLPRLIKEHSPLDLADRNAWMILLFGATYVALLAGTVPRKPRVVWLLPLVWLVLTCLRVRHAPLFAVGALVAIADFFPRTRYAEALEARGSDLFETPDPEPESLRERLAAWAVPAAAVLLALVLQLTRVAVPVVGHGWARLDPATWPVQLIDELQARQHERPGGTRIFNEYPYGGFIIYYAPGFKVFADDRCELFGDEWLSDFLDAPLLDPAEHVKLWEKEYGPFDYALVYNQPGPGFLEYFQKADEWEEVKRCETAVLFKRK